MSQEPRLPAPCRTQLDLHREAAELELRPILAVDLHKAKFDQRKALQEYREDRPLDETLPGNVYTRSQGMVAARGEDCTQVSIDDAWTTIADGEPWIGSIPVQLYRQQQDVYLRGYPYLIGFADGHPRVILNKILPEKAENMDRFYCNEWARPWLNAEILDATGFNTENLVIATMKAREPDDGKTDENQVLAYLYRNARENVRALLRIADEVELTPWEPQEPDIPHQSDYVRTQLIGYRTDYSLYNQLGHGDTIRDVIRLFKGQRDPKGTPPDRGLSLPYAVREQADI
jgi:hypothetical protein